MIKLDELRALGPPPTPKPFVPTLAPPGTAPGPDDVGTMGARNAAGAVRRAGGAAESDDLDRIVYLPRRVAPAGPRADAMIELMTARLAQPGTCRCKALGRPCPTRLKLTQAWALYEIGLYGGLLGPIGVGEGKTALNLLAPLVLDPPCRLAVLLVPPGLVGQLRDEYIAWSGHFRMPSMVLPAGAGQFLLDPALPVVHVLPYSRLSRPDATDRLEQLAPDTIIADEAHRLRHADTATVARVRRYVDAHKPRVLAWSGTLTSKSLRDYAHLSAWSLGERSPLPLEHRVLEEWAEVLDPSDWPSPPGKLLRLCNPGEHVQAGFRRRLLETPGVVASTDRDDLAASLTLIERDPGQVPAEVRTALARLDASWTRDDGEELVDAASVAACARQVSCGFFYRWVFPRGESRALVEEWLAARKEWHKELREKLKRRQEHLDSPLLCAKAALRAWSGDYDGDLPAWKADTWPRWRAVHDQVKPQTEPVWLDDFLVRDACAWARKEHGVVWYEHDAYGRAVADRLGVPLHGGGPNAGALILAENGKRSIVASIKAHGTGRDGLQHRFATQLVANPPASGAGWEQLLGRLHRTGQQADEVEAHLYRHTDSVRGAFDNALAQAHYIQSTLGNRQKLLIAGRAFRVTHG